MAVDMLVDSAQLDADLTTVADAIRAKGGTSAQLSFPDGMAQAIEDIETGGGSTLYFTDRNTPYMPNMVLTGTTLSIQRQFADASELETVEFPNLAEPSGSYVFANNTKMTHIKMPILSSLGSSVLRNIWCNPTFVLGGIGHPISSLPSNAMSGGSAGGTIIIFVADDAVLPLNYSPWGRGAAEIIYKSATTGEVITV